MPSRPPRSQQPTMGWGISALWYPEAASIDRHRAPRPFLVNIPTIHLLPTTCLNRYVQGKAGTYQPICASFSSPRHVAAGEQSADPNAPPQCPLGAECSMLHVKPEYMSQVCANPFACCADCGDSFSKSIFETVPELTHLRYNILAVPKNDPGLQLKPRQQTTQQGAGRARGGTSDEAPRPPVAVEGVDEPAAGGVTAKTTPEVDTAAADLLLQNAILLDTVPASRISISHAVQRGDHRICPLHMGWTSVAPDNLTHGFPPQPPACPRGKDCPLLHLCRPTIEGIIARHAVPLSEVTLIAQVTTAPIEESSSKTDEATE